MIWRHWRRWSQVQTASGGFWLTGLLNVVFFCSVWLLFSGFWTVVTVVVCNNISLMLWWLYLPIKRWILRQTCGILWWELWLQDTHRSYAVGRLYQCVFSDLTEFNQGIRGCCYCIIEWLLITPSYSLLWDQSWQCDLVRLRLRRQESAPVRISDDLPNAALRALAETSLKVWGTRR